MTKLTWDDFNIPFYEERQVNIPVDYSEDEDSSSGSHQTGAPIPDWIIEERVRFSNWKYIPEKEIIINVKIQKQISLMSLNSSYIILNLLKSTGFKPELELDNLIIELEKICFLKYKKSLKSVISEHLDQAILWNIKKEEELKLRQKHDEIKKTQAHKIMDKKGG